MDGWMEKSIEKEKARNYGYIAYMANIFLLDFFLN